MFIRVKCNVQLGLYPYYVMIYIYLPDSYNDVYVVWDAPFQFVWYDMRRTCPVCTWHTMYIRTGIPCLLSSSVQSIIKFHLFFPPLFFFSFLYIITVALDINELHYTTYTNTAKTEESTSTSHCLCTTCIIMCISFGRSMVRICLASNMTANFFAYMLTHRDFRGAFLKTFCHQRYLAEKRKMAFISRKATDSYAGASTDVSAITLSVIKDAAAEHN